MNRTENRRYYYSFGEESYEIIMQQESSENFPMNKNRLHHNNAYLEFIPMIRDLNYPGLKSGLLFNPLAAIYNLIPTSEPIKVDPS